MGWEFSFAKAPLYLLLLGLALLFVGGIFQPSTTRQRNK
jgi:hypothetical protein